MTKKGIQGCKKIPISFVHVQMSESTLEIWETVWEHMFTLIVEASTIRDYPVSDLYSPETLQHNFVEDVL